MIRHTLTSIPTLKPLVRAFAITAIILLVTAGATSAEVLGRCIQDDRIAAGLSPFGGNFCTANDLTFVLIGLGIQEDGCANSSDNSNILNLRAIVENTGAATRYDAGLWISPQSDQTRCSLSGELCSVDGDCSGGQNLCVSTARWGSCVREFFREPAYVQGNITCSPSTGGVDLACGDQGPYINDDGDGCGDVRKFGTGGPPDCGQTVDLRLDPTNAACNTPDTNQDQSVFDFEGALTFPCVDRDADGFMEIPTCTSWGQNASDISCPLKTCSTAGTQCVVDADCPGVETCDAPTCNICAGSGISCTDDTGCPSGQECTGNCTVTGAFCSDTVTCTTGQTCSTRTCQGSGDGCTITANCPTGQTCQASTDPICRTQLAVPGTSSKCACDDGLNSNVPVAELGLSCVCDTPTTVPPGFPVTCELTYNNPQPVNCTPDTGDPERFRCGSLGYVRFDLDDGISGATSGTFSGICSGENGFCSGTRGPCTDDTDCPIGQDCLVPSCSVDTDCPGGETCSLTSTAGEAEVVSEQLLWTPDPFAGADTLGVVGTGDTDSLRFIYTVSASAPDGGITVTASSLWSNKTCSTTTSTVCEQDVQCPMGETCELDFAFGVNQAALTTTCSVTADATYATVSSFKAIREGGQVVVEWETSAEVGTLGFNVFRHDKSTNSWVQLNEHPLVAAQHVPGAYYRWEDRTAHPGGELVYRLVEVDDRGGSRIHGPFRVRAETRAEPPRALGRGREFEVEARAAKRNRVEPRGQRAQKPGGLSTAVGERVKIEVTGSGLYRVEALQIASALGKSAAEISVLIGSNGLSLTYGEEPVAWHPSADGQAVVFYGEAIDSPFTRENVYWLAPGTGQQMSVASSQPPAFARYRWQSFMERLPFEADLLLRPTLGRDPEGDYWFWKVIITGNPDYERALLDIEVPSVAVSRRDSTLMVRLFGLPTQELESTYHALIRVNGQEIGTASWSRAGWHEEEVFFAQGLLREGSNTVEVEGLEGSFFVDSFDVGYQRRYEAVGGNLLLRGDRHDNVSVSGFSSQDVSVYELADPRAPRRLHNVVVRWSVDGTYRASFGISDPKTPYLAIQNGAWKSPTSVQGVPFSSLRSGQNSADYLVVTSSELAVAANRLADYRRVRGLDVMVVEVDEIMNEFNWGISDPAAIRDFFSYAYQNWSRAPRMAVLAGKGSYDYRNLLGEGGNLVPPIMAATSQGLVSADNLYGDVSGDDGIPEIAIGRLPVLASEELDTIVGKIAAYESSRGLWKREVLMIADDPDDAGNFPADSDSLSAQIPGGLGLEKVYLSQPFTAEQARNQIVDSINLGTLLVSYAGHGGFDRLADEGLLRSEDVGLLVNDERLPVIAAMTCNISLFAFPGFTSLGEELLIHDAGGAAAVWAPTALSLNSQAIALGDRVMESLFSRMRQPLGRALARAIKDYVSNGGRREVALSYSLLGDPALEWKRPISLPQ